MSIIKLAAFESGVELTKEASATLKAAWLHTPPAVKEVLKGMGVDGETLSSHIGGQATKMTGDAARVAGGAANYATGVDATGALGKALAHIKGNKTAYLGAGLLGAGAYGAHRMMNKKK